MELGRSISYDHAQTQQPHFPSSLSSQPSTCTTRVCPPQPQSQDPVAQLPLDQRRNPRRCPANASQKPPPTLVRQDERKASFVDGLVDSATQMVEVIWPLSVTPCRPQSGGVLSLRRYIEETLRRSRTSYSTLQVALYYLVLIMPFVPRSDFTMQQTVDSASVRSLQCGRRMFLAALILASKYLQDRNYSAKAWSKMSGLKVAEINLNERAFLEAVNWKLHIPENTFKQWTELVLRYTPSQFPPPPDQTFSTSEQKVSWKSVIPLLTPELEMVSPKSVEISVCAQPVPLVTAYSALPSFLEPQPEVVPPTPSLAVSISYLPTPRMTPPPVNTPAVSVASVESDRASMGKVSRRWSMAASEVSTVLSPESMISDASSRLSRCSSVSSVSTGLSMQNFQAKVIVASPMSMTMEQSLAAYDAQPKVASRACKRSRSSSFDTEEDEEEDMKLQARVRYLVGKGATKEATVVLSDDDAAGPVFAASEAKEQVLMSLVPYKIMFEEGDRKRRRMSIHGEKSFGSEAITAY